MSTSLSAVLGATIGIIFGVLLIDSYEAYKARQTSVVSANYGVESEYLSKSKSTELIGLANKELTVKLSDGRTVTCLQFRFIQGSNPVSCDWEHAK